MIDLYEKLNSVSLATHSLLKEKGKTLSVAESFTGGTISSSLIKISGASTFFNEGIVCYSNEAKNMRLGVDIDVINRYGAVSEKTARVMIKGLFNVPNPPDYAIATTGNADVTLENSSIDGEAYVAVASDSEVIVKKIQFEGSRQENILLGAIIALETLNDLVKK